MWRMSDDFWHNWESLYAMFSYAEHWSAYVGGSSFPDADMLPVGAILQDYSPENRSKFTPDELKTMLSLWCMIRSPLFIGGELTKLTDSEIALLTNEKLLEMHRVIRFVRPLMRRVINETEYAVWLATDSKSTYYLGVFNLSDAAADGLGLEAGELGA